MFFLITLRCVLTCICTFTKFLWLFALPRKEAQFVAECLISVFDRYGFGPPKILQSDNGTEFDNQIVNSLQTYYGFQIVHSRPYHPQSQGVVERTNLSNGQVLMKYKYECLQSSSPFNWSDNLVLAQIASLHNRTWHSSIRMSPFEAFFGRPHRQGIASEGFSEVVTVQAEEDGRLLHENETNEKILLSPGPSNPSALRKRYLEAAEKAHEETRKRIAKRAGTVPIFNENDLIYAMVLQNSKAKRGKLAKKMHVAGVIFRVHQLPDGTPTHKYDIKDLEGNTYKDVSIRDLRIRKTRNELNTV